MDFVFSIVSIVKLWSGNWATAVLFNEYKVAPLVACCPPLLTLESLFYAFMQPCIECLFTVSQKYPASKSPKYCVRWMMEVSQSWCPRGLSW